MCDSKNELVWGYINTSTFLMYSGDRSNPMASVTDLEYSMQISKIL